MLQNVIITAKKVTRGEYNIPTSCTIRNQRKRRDKQLILRVKSTYTMCHIIKQLMTFNSMDTRMY
jgi:hypothetical protein